MDMETPNMEKKAWKTLASKMVYDNPWINVTEFDIINPSGNKGIYGKVHYKNTAIGIVPVDNDGMIYMVRQFRYVLGQYSLEIPEGGGHISSNTLESAKRELKEETGLEANYWEQLLVMHLSNSVSDEYAVVYLAKGLVQGKSNLEDTEDIEVIKISLDEAYQKIPTGEITDAITVAALQQLRIKRLEGIAI
jgi:8-oxo-dGTP pyrophosphatase MutT (NUDIX family)